MWVFGVGGWLTALEASYVVMLPKPYYRNFGKRLIKSPRVYFIETGLAAYLLGLRTAEQVGRDPLLGRLFESRRWAKCCGILCKDNAPAGPKRRRSRTASRRIEA